MIQTEIKDLEKTVFLGLGKVQYGSNVCKLTANAGAHEAELFLTERATKVKSDSAWPEKGIRHFLPQLPTGERLRLSENRDADDPLAYETRLNKQNFLFKELTKKGMTLFSRQFNPRIRYMPHHYCHAMAALAISPFDESLIVVMDGAGSQATDFPKSSFEVDHLPTKSERRGKFEECTVYLQTGGKLHCVYKRWQTFRSGAEKDSYPGWTLSEGLGIFYEESAKYIFNSIREAGKVMGLSPYGKPQPVSNRVTFLKKLDWQKSFQGRSKADWENSGRFKLYANLAATVQNHFEDDLFRLLKKLSKTFPNVRNLIFTGGCALNCIGNMKILYNGYFDKVFIPPFPNDDCISFGAAYGDLFSVRPNEWKRRDWSQQQGAFGPKSSVPNMKRVAQVFQGYELRRPDNIFDYTAEALARGEIVAWFQGRSESGPRALGNRSILSRIDIKGRKDLLNAKVKGREAFRPYGSSCTLEKAADYFEIPQGFESPFMSFAPRVRPKYKDLLREVTHTNKTSRIQTVSRIQNPRFWGLIQAFGDKTGLYCLLNTSLNIMGQPIVETVEDAKNFLDTTNVDALVVGDIYIPKKSNRPSKNNSKK
jgi:carbamoyltransferase